MTKRGVLFAVGITLQSLAFFGDHATEIPFAHRVIAPRHFYASQTVAALGADPSLTLSNAVDRGALELAAILAAHAAKKLDRPDRSGIRIDKINVSGSEFVDGKMATSIHWEFILDKPIDHKGAMADHGTDSWSFETIKEEVDALKHPNMLVFALLLFLVGTVIDVIAFRMEEAQGSKIEGRPEQGAAPNGGPATSLGNSGATEGPPSVS